MKFIEFELDKIRNFRMSMMAMSRIEKKFNKPFSKIDHENLMIEDFAFLLWACMDQKNREEVSPEKLIELIDEFSNIKSMYEIFAQIVNEAFGIEKNEQGTAETEIGVGNQQ